MCNFATMKNPVTQHFWWHMGVQFLSRRRWWLSSSSQRAHPFVNDVEFQGYCVLSAMSRNIATYCDSIESIDIFGRVGLRESPCIPPLVWIGKLDGVGTMCLSDVWHEGVLHLRDGKRRWWVHIMTGAYLLLLNIDQSILYSIEGLSYSSNPDE